MRLPYDKEYKTNLVVICVRNPLDIFPSEFLQVCTLSHNLGIKEDFNEVFPEWDHVIKVETKLWEKWHHYWIEKAQSSEVPIIFTRFEDLLSTPKYYKIA